MTVSVAVTPLKAVQPAVDRETLETLERLVSAAKAGKVVGLAYVAIHCGPDYSGDVTGRAKAHPIFTRGVIRALEDAVTEFITKPK